MSVILGIVTHDECSSYQNHCACEVVWFQTPLPQLGCKNLVNSHGLEFGGLEIQNAAN